MAKTPTRKVGRAAPKRKAPARKGTRKKAAAPKTDDRIVLPQKEADPPPNIDDYTVFLYGKKGVGKTSMCAQWRTADGQSYTIFQWEPRRRNVRAKQTPRPGEPPLNWERWLQYVEILLDNPRPIATDTIDRAWKSCVEWMRRQWGIKKVNDLPGNQRMAFWAEAKEELATTYEALLTSGCPMIFTSHYKKVTITPRDGDAFDEWEPGCGAAWDLMKDICDLVLFYYYRKGERSITVRGTNLLYASPGPVDHFLDPDGNPLIEFMVSSQTPKHAYQDLLAGYNNKMYGFIEEEEPEEDEEEDEEEE